MTNDALGRFNQSLPVPSLVTTMLPRMFPIVPMSTQGNVCLIRRYSCSCAVLIMLIYVQ